MYEKGYNLKQNSFFSSHYPLIFFNFAKFYFFPCLSFFYVDKLLSEYIRYTVQVAERSVQPVRNGAGPQDALGRHQGLEQGEEEALPCRFYLLLTLHVRTVLVEDNDEEEEVEGGPGYTNTGEIFEKFKQFHNVVF